MAQVEVSELYANIDARLDKMNVDIQKEVDEYSKNVKMIDEECKIDLDIKEGFDSIDEICEEYKRNMSEIYDEQKQCINVLRQNAEDERNERKQFSQTMSEIWEEQKRSLEKLQEMMLQVYKSHMETQVEPEGSKPVETGTHTHATTGKLPCVGAEDESEVHVLDKAIHENTDMQTVWKGHVGINENMDCNISNKKNNCKNVRWKDSIKKDSLNVRKPNGMECSGNNVERQIKHGLYLSDREHAQRKKNKFIKKHCSNNNNNYNREKIKASDNKEHDNSVYCKHSKGECCVHKITSSGMPEAVRSDNNKHYNNTSKFKAPKLMHIINNLNLSKYRETECKVNNGAGVQNKRYMNRICKEHTHRSKARIIKRYDNNKSNNNSENIRNRAKENKSKKARCNKSDNEYCITEINPNEMNNSMLNNNNNNSDNRKITSGFKCLQRMHIIDNLYRCTYRETEWKGETKMINQYNNISNLMINDQYNKKIISDKNVYGKNGPKPGYSMKNLYLNTSKEDNNKNLINKVRLCEGTVKQNSKRRDIGCLILGSLSRSVIKIRVNDLLLLLYERFMYG